MPLTIIKGPPNSGRTEMVKRQFEARIADSPVLVVPSTDDIFGWERRLTKDRGAFLGGKVVHFKDLIDEIVSDPNLTGRDFGSRGRLASPLRRRHLAARAIREKWPAVGDRLGFQPGLIDAVLRLIDEFRENLLDPASLEERIARAEVAVPTVISSIYRSYLEGLEAAGLTDLPALGLEATRRPLENWAGRPVFVAGFDDLTEQQLVLLTRLGRETSVTIALTHELGNEAMAVTESLLGRLKKAGATEGDPTKRPESPRDHDPLLFEIERSFGQRDPKVSLKPSDALTLMRSSGRRGEAEAVGAEIARLVSAGTDPGEIAIAIESPGETGQPFRDVLAEYRIPATLEAEISAPATAVGQVVLNLLRATSPGGAPNDLFRFLRGPVGVDRELVDEVEFRAVRQGLDEVDKVAGLWRDIAGSPPPGWDEIRNGKITGTVMATATAAAINLASEGALPASGLDVATETQMSTAIRQAAEDLDQAAGGQVSAADLVEALTSGTVKTWSIPTSHTVRIASPYAMRAKRVRYLFIASLQEKSLGDEGGGAFLTREARAAIGMPAMTDPEQQERYLFYSCLSVPTGGLWLSTRSSDVHGKAEFPSPLIGETTRLFENEGRGLRSLSRTGSDIVFAASDAPSEDELARALAAGYPLPDGLGETGRSTEERVRRAEVIEVETNQLRSLGSEAALAVLAEENVFSATALEAFIECPYKWFVERALRPVEFGPEPEALPRGVLIHDVLARLYSDRPHRVPSAKDLDEWTSAARKLVDEFAKRKGIGLGGDNASHRLARRRATVDINRFLAQEAARGDSKFSPAWLESAFGFEGKEDSKPALKVNEHWSLRGRIDRIDVSEEGGHGIVFDYKTGRSSFRSLAEIRRAGKVQLQLYLRALEQAWRIPPTAGLYSPVYPGNGRPRGLADASSSGLLGYLKLYDADQSEEFDAEIEGAVKLADQAARRILAGEIYHDPAGCRCHLNHAAVPDRKPATAEDEAK